MIGSFMLFVASTFASAGCQENFPDVDAFYKTPTLIPTPLQMAVRKGQLTIRDGQEISADESLKPLAALCAEEFQTSFGIKLRTGGSTGPAILLKLDKKLAEEEYRISIGKAAVVKGGSYLAVAYGTATLLQLARWNLGAYFDPRLEPFSKLVLKRCEIHDKPAFAYRGAMVDVARQFHSIDTLKQIVTLCRFYKVRYLQLHLTDDQAFTFPSTAYPLVATPKAYTLAELKDLVAFADERGVTIIPEFDVPGHSAALIRAMPDLFKIKGTQPYEHHATINFANPAALQALDTIVGEMCEVFKSSPYFHIGGDEADISLVAQHPDFKKLIGQYELKDGAEQELYRRFLCQMNDIVKKHGKKTIVWEGFGRNPESKFPIPKDVTVMEFESAYQAAPELIKDGYTVINSAWTPLYIVNQHVWKPQKVYDWSINEFGRVSNLWQTVTWVNADSTGGIAGAQACEWEQPEYLAVQGFLGVLPAMSERVWNPNAKRDFDRFKDRLAANRELLEKLLSPISVYFEGARQAADTDFDRMEFPINAFAILKRKPEGYIVRYTADGSNPTVASAEWKEHVGIEATTTIRARAFGKDGTAFGGEFARTVYKNVPKTPNLATGKPVTCSGGTQGPQSPELAVDNNLDLGSSWWAAPAPQWIQVDLQKAQKIGSIVVFPYWDGKRYYQYTVEVSADAKQWTKVADRSDNTIPASSNGDTISLTDCNARYIRVTMLKGSANEGVHIVEIQAWP